MEQSREARSVSAATTTRIFDNRPNNEHGDARHKWHKTAQVTINNESPELLISRDTYMPWVQSQGPEMFQSFEFEVNINKMDGYKNYLFCISSPSAVYPTTIRR